MSNIQLKLDDLWNNDKFLLNCSISATENEIYSLPLVLPSSAPTPTTELQQTTYANEVELDVGIVIGNELNAGVTVGNEFVVERDVGVVLGNELDAKRDAGVVLEVERDELEVEDEIQVINKQSCNESSSSINEHNYSLSTVPKGYEKKQTTSVRSKHRIQYLCAWEKQTEAQYKTYTFDDLGAKHETFMCWLYYKNKSMRCRLCEKYGKTRNTNGKM